MTRAEKLPLVLILLLTGGKGSAGGKSHYLVTLNSNTNVIAFLSLTRFVCSDNDTDYNTNTDDHNY